MYNYYNFYQDDDDYGTLTDSAQTSGEYTDSKVIEDSAPASSGGSGKHPKKKNHMGLGKKIGLCASFAAVFGMVSAGVYIGTTKLASSGQSTSTVQTAAVTAGSETQSSSTESTSAGSTSGTSATSIGSTADANNADKEANATTTTAAESGTLTTEEVAANTMPAMVAITNKSVSEVQNYFGGSDLFGSGSSTGNGQGQTQETTSMGTGVIIGETDDVLYIATNQHVVDSANTLSVAFVDNSVAEGTIVGEDETNDLAVVSVKKSDLSSDTLSKIKIISMGSSDDLTVGEQVVAIGNALGYGQSVSEGIVSALNRTMESGEGVYAKGLIQTDAAINPGNSGGALLNMKGELIGINSAKYADTEVEGMGYAIPISTAEPILESLIKGTDATASSSTDSSTADANSGSTNGNANGSSGSNSAQGSDVTSDAYLGISCTGISSEYAQYYNIPEGVYVSAVTSGSAAESAGIKSGDIITAIDGTTISSVDDLTTVLNQHSSGDTVKITLSRSNGNSYASTSVSCTLGSKSSSGTKTSWNME